MMGPYTYTRETFPAKAKINILNNYKAIETEELHTANRLNKMVVCVSTGYRRFVRIRGTGYHLKPQGQVIDVTSSTTYTSKHSLHPSTTAIPSRKFSLVSLRNPYFNNLTRTISLMEEFCPTDVYRGMGIYKRYKQFKFKPGSKGKKK
jgi:ribosomal protein L6P/L9E